MKKIYYLLLILASALAIASCKKTASVQTEVSEPWVYDEQLPVPIEFGSVSGLGLETKGAITSNALYSIPFGIYGIDLENGVTLSSSEEKSHLAQCESTENILQFVESLNGNVKHLYYPIETKNNFTFYGYHVGTEDVEGLTEQTTNAYYKTISLDNIDILWARATATPIDLGGGNLVKGFNSKYSRVARQQSTPSLYYPQLDFRHVTTAFHVKVKAYDEEAAASFAVDRVRVTNLTLTNVDDKVKLIIADRSNPSREGTLESLGEEKHDLVRDNLEVVPTAAGAEISDGFFVLPGTYSDSRIRFTLETDPEGTAQTYECVLPLPQSSESFEVAKSYTFTIIVKSFNEIIIKASLNDWESGFTEEDLEQEKDVVMVIE